MPCEKRGKKIKNGINKQLVAAIYFALYQPRNQPTTVYPFERTHHFNENHVYSVIYLEILFLPVFVHNRNHEINSLSVK